MTPVIPFSTSDFAIVPGTAFTIKINNRLNTRCNLSRKYAKHTSSSQRLVLPFPSSVRLFPRCRSDCTFFCQSNMHMISATGTDVAVEEPDSPVLGEDSGGVSEVPAAETSETSSSQSNVSSGPAQSRRSRPSRKSEMPPVNKEDLVPGATFTGKVRSIQPFGAFVDFGAFTDGLVHVSRLSDRFVKDVGSIVSVGQEVKVRLLEANFEAGRISLSMRESDDTNKLQQQKDATATASSDKPRPARRTTSKPGQRREVKSSKFGKGQDLVGTVKNLTRAGSFISLPEGEEGFLPTAEEADDGLGSMMGASSLQVGQEISIRVLRVTRGQVTLTMKKEEDEKLDFEHSQGVVHAATNPFVLAFRQNKEIAAFLDDRDNNIVKTASKPVELKPSEETGQTNQAAAPSDVPEVQDQLVGSDVGLATVPTTIDEGGAHIETSSKEVALGANIADSDKEPESIESSSLQSVDGEFETIEKEADDDSAISDPEGIVSSADQIVGDAPSTEGVESKSGSVGEMAGENLSSKSTVSEEVVKSHPDKAIAKGEVQMETAIPSIVDETASKGVAVGANIADGDKEPESIESSSLQSVDGEVQTLEKEADDDSAISDPEGNVFSTDQIAGDAPSTEGVESKLDLLGEMASENLSLESTVSEEVVKNHPDEAIAKGEVQMETAIPSIVDETSSKGVVVGANIADTDKESESIESSSLQRVDGEFQTIEKEADEDSAISDPEGVVSGTDQIVGDAPSTEGVESKSDSLGEIASENLSSESPASEEVVESHPGEAIAKGELQMETAIPYIVDKTSSKEVAAADNVAHDDKELESIRSNTSQSVDGEDQTTGKEADESQVISDPDMSVSSTDCSGQDAPSTDRIQADGKSESLRETAGQNLTSESPVSEEVVAKADFEMQTSNVENEVPSAPTGNEDVGAAPENDKISGSAKQPDPPSPEEAKDEEENIENVDPSANTDETPIMSSENQGIEAAESQGESTMDEAQIQIPVMETEIPSVSEAATENLKPGPEKNDNIGNSNGQSGSPSSNGQSGSPSPKESVPKATISPALVKQLREETGAGMMDCKKALSETGGDIVKAQEFLRKKGLASAEKKASRATAEGRIGSYIHDSRIGVLVEVNCETDFVSRGDIFKELVDDLAMQVAACPQVQYLVTDDIPEEIVSKEREIEMQKEDLLSKPEQIRSKIVEGRINKRLEELALLEQPYIKNDKVVVKDWVKQTIATIGENIKVKRFVRYNLGEGLEKKSQDFAAEVAAQTAAKSVATPAKVQSPAPETTETSQKPPAVTVSAALVKQLREETGAGMMDCKKALSETGGDLEKAQEYLRKKGLSTADKKSSRLAAEGRIGSYIHDSRIGVLIEVNCETDFVGRSENFKELVDDLAMQVVACPQVQFVSVEDIPESIVNKEKQLEMQREDILSKPENIRERIVEGRVSKRLGELALLEQPFIKNDSILVKDLVKQTVAALGENIKVRRFVKFTLGETVEDTKTESCA